MLRFISIAFACVAAAFTSLSAAAEEKPKAKANVKLPLELVVTAGKQDRTDALVSFVLPSNKNDAPSLRVIESLDGKPSLVPVQVDSQGGRLWWVARGVTAAGTTRTYRLEAAAGEPPPQIKVADSERTVEVSFESKALLQYNKAHVEPPADVNPLYGRSAHIHPVRSPSGAIVTDEFPADHLHQSGIFLAYTKTEFEGRNVDFWNLAGGKGRVRFKKLIGVESGPVFGQIQVQHEHVDFTGGEKKVGDGIPDGGKVALVETWTMRIWTPGWDSGYWLLDIDSRVSCAGESPLKLPEYHYGGMAIRAARSWTPPLPTVLTSEGDERLKGNHTRPRWCDVSGPIENRTAGITMMTHPGNFRFPEPLRIHPTMPYMVYTPSFAGAWEIQPGMPHESRYRFVVHDGELSAAQIDRLWSDFAEPLVAVAK